MNPEQLEAYFWSHVEKSDIPGKCWLWKGALTSRGHGMIVLVRNKRIKRAHRVSWELHKKVQLHPMELVGQSCGVKTCVNPEHLIIVKHSHWHIKNPQTR